MTMFSQRCFKEFTKKSLKFCKTALINDDTPHSKFKYISKRFLQSSSVSYKLHYFAGENNFAHDTLKNARDRYALAGEEKICGDNLSLDLFLSTLNPTSSLSTTEIIDAFKVLSDFAHEEWIEIHSNIFDKFIDMLTDNIKNMSNEQLFDVFKQLRKWPPADSAKTRNFVEIWTALDDVLKERCETFNIDELLLFIDNIYRANLIRHFLFGKYAIAKVIRKAKLLTPSQLVQISFYAGANRWKFDMFDLEIRFFDCIDFLTIDEICIVCMGFFKTQTPFRDPHLLNVIMNRLQMSKEIPNSILVTSFLKMVKYSITEESNEELYKTLDWFCSKLEQLSPMGCTHLALAGTTSRLKHEKLLNKLAEIFQRNASNIRLKDLERVANSYSLFNMENVNGIPMFDIVVDELRKPERLQEIQVHPTSFVNCLMYLVVRNRFPLDLIAYALDEDFISKYYRYHISNGKSMHIVNNSVAIEQTKFYKGPFLNQETQANITKKYFRYLPERGSKYRLNTEQLQVFDIMSTIADYRGNWNYLKAIHILPHYDKGDIVICNGTNDNWIKVENYFSKKEFGKIYHAPDTKKQWLVIIPTQFNGYIWKSKELTGPVLMKDRQLKALGYIPVFLPLAEWQRLKSTVEKVDYLKNLLLTVDFKF